MPNSSPESNGTNLEINLEVELYQEYNDVSKGYKYVIETERRLYLANHVDMQVRNESSDTYFEISINDAWVWDFNRKNRYIKQAHIITFKDVNIEEIAAPK